MTKTYRSKGLGAMIDEYERAINELVSFVREINETDFIAEYPNEAPKCRSIQIIMQHVTQAAYRYADDIRGALNLPIVPGHIEILEEKNQSLLSLNKAFEYTVGVFEDKWLMTDDEIDAVTMTTKWGIIYTLEQMLEHAIVHVLRHRRQVERLIGK